MVAKKSAGKSAKKTSKKASKKKVSKSSSSKKASKKAATRAAKPKKKASPKPKVTSREVNLGHVFALRPRVSTSFKPGDFSGAKSRLQDESYASMADAARAVAEKALELTREGKPERRGRRF